MQIKSLVQHQGFLQVVDVEIDLVPGVPQVHFLGLADQGIKESEKRIRSAFRHQGFEFPKRQTTIVNLRPHHFRKTSRGLELAVALGILLKTEQIELKIEEKEILAYGELSLEGQVHSPEDLDRFFSEDQILLTGTGDFSHGQKGYKIQDLQRLKVLHHFFEQSKNLSFQRPNQYRNFLFSSREAEWLKLMSLGGFHGLMAGRAGLGKTTLARALLEFLPSPSAQDPEIFKQSYKYFGPRTWRPLVEPHHTISFHNMLGGGNPLQPGEITRAHGGVLLMDEYLEFDRQVLESLREPMIEGVIRLRKNLQRADFPAQFQLVATTNLCRCGHWVPNRERSCLYSANQCFGVLRKLSGPLLDRFQILYIFEKPSESERKISQDQILEDLDQISKFKAQAEAQNLHKSDLTPPWIDSRLKTASPRRLSALSQVSQLLAYIDLEISPQNSHWEKARSWSIDPFIELLQQD